MAIVHLALGSNLKDRRANLLHAQNLYESWVGRIKARSPMYESAACYVEDQPAFLNMALLAETDLTPLDLLDQLKSIESYIGRKPKSLRFGPREIDIDIIFYDNMIFDELGLTIPHPRYSERAFVLQPLCDIAPKFKCPRLGMTLETLRDNLPNLDGIQLYKHVPSPPPA